MCCWNRTRNHFLSEWKSVFITIALINKSCPVHHSIIHQLRFIHSPVVVILPLKRKHHGARSSMLKLTVLLQEKPVPPQCGTTRPGVIFTGLTRRHHLLSSLKTSSMPSSLRPGSSSCSEIQSRGEINTCCQFAILAVYLPSLLFVSCSQAVFGLLVF